MVRKLTVGVVGEGVGWSFLCDVTYGDLMEDPRVKGLLDAMMKIRF